MALHTILVPTDFSSPADLAFEAARDLARRCGARIELVHAFHIPPEAAPYLTGTALARMESEARSELSASPLGDFSTSVERAARAPAIGCSRR